MTKFTLIGILSSVGGGVLIGFQILSKVMGSKAVSKSLSLGDIVGERYLEWAANLPAGGSENIVETFMNLPVFVILFCIGGLCFILDYFFGRR